mmetsp:Transcript_51400/g.55641  ORF Transcript_51400/g.55641 Transcript_51400/m.55641 type:complete len:928 (+) Transcript_51400:56-2839(+)
MSDGKLKCPSCRFQLQVNASKTMNCPFDEPNSKISSDNNSSINPGSTSNEQDSSNENVSASSVCDDNVLLTMNVQQDRPIEEVARDTSIILEICYGNAKDILGELSAAFIGEDTVVIGNEVGEKIESIIKREKKKKKTPQKRRKKNEKRKKEKNTTVSVPLNTIRDATGKIVRKPKKIKGRYKVVRKELIKRGKDVKIELPTISENLDDDDDSQSNNDGVSFISTSSIEEDDAYQTAYFLIDSTKEDNDNHLKSKEVGQETDINCHDIEQPACKVKSCTEVEEENSNAERKVDEDDRNEDDTLSLEIERYPVASDNFLLNVRYNDDRVTQNNEDSVHQATQLENYMIPTITNVEVNLVSPPSVDSTECTSTGGNDLEEKSSLFFGSYWTMICCGASFVVVVAAFTVLAFYLVSRSGKETENIFPEPSFKPIVASKFPSLRPSLFPICSPPDGLSILTPSLSPSKRMELSSIPTVAPTLAPTSIFDTSHTSCQLPIQKGDLQTFEAENASKRIGKVIISDKNDGYCGKGYVTDLTELGSGFEFASLKVNTTGYYRVTLRYNYNGKSAISLLLKIDDTEGGQFDLKSTGNKTTWMVEGADDILLSQGEHLIQVLLPTETKDGPRIDWLTLSLLEPVSRFDYLVTLLTQFIDVTTPSQSQISSLVWMASKDPIDWSFLTDQEIIERYALVQIYNSASGDIWLNTNEWLSEFHVCTWYGIACSEEKFVTDLMLDKNGLTGPIPIDLFLLTNLILISLDTNSLEGTIPTGISKLKKLSKIFMQANFLTGFLPSVLGSLKFLTNVDLRANDFNGPIPQEIYFIGRLESLALSSNDLEGTLSTSIGKLRALIDLDLQSDNLSGSLPTTLGQLTSLKTLALGYNQFSGSIPSELGLLTDLSLLDVSSNQLTGMLPTELTLLNDTIVNHYDNDIID